MPNLAYMHRATRMVRRSRPRVATRAFGMTFYNRRTGPRTRGGRRRWGSAGASPAHRSGDRRTPSRGPKL